MGLSDVSSFKSIIDREQKTMLDFVFQPSQVSIEDRRDRYYKPTWPSEENLTFPYLSVAAVTPVCDKGEAQLFNQFPLTLLPIWLQTIRFKVVKSCVALHRHVGTDSSKIPIKSRWCQISVRRIRDVADCCKLVVPACKERFEH